MNRKGFATIPLVLIVLAVITAVGGYFTVIRSTARPVFVVAPPFASQEECEQKTKGPCGIAICDLVPEGKTFEEVCGRGWKNGWRPISTSTTTSSVSQIDTSNWKTYRNEQYGFEFKYPPDLLVEVVEADGQDRSVVLREATMPQVSYYRVGVSPHLVVSTLEQWFKLNFGDQFPQPVRRSATFAGLPTLQLNDPTPGCQRDLIAVLRYGILYTVSEPSCLEEPQHTQVVAEINSTFKFTEPQPKDLTLATAIDLVKKHWLWCEGMNVNCVKTEVSIEKRGDVWFVVSISSGLADDSATAQKTEAPVYNVNGEWQLGDVVITTKCAYGRGHQDFSTEPCI